MLALLFKPRRFAEFEWSLIEEFPEEVPENLKVKNPKAWERLRRAHVRSWKIPRKTLARRLKALLAKGWIIRTVLPEHGHHVEYRLDFSKSEEMLKELPLPRLRLTRSQKKLEKRINVVIPLKEELSGLDDLSDDEVIEIHIRLRSGEFICPRCLVKGEGKKAFNVSMDADGKFYCRNCAEEVSIEECNKLLLEKLRKNLAKKFIKGLRDTRRFFKAIDKQLEAESYDKDDSQEI